MLKIRNYQGVKMLKKKERFIHKSSYIEKNASIGKGTRIWHFCHIMHDASIGNFCNIGQNVFVDAGVKIGNKVKIQNNVSIYRKVTLEDGVFCGPSCVFTNVLTPRALFPKTVDEFLETMVGKGATIGANATIVCGNNIGKHAFIGAGAVITKSVKNYALVAGNPARQVGWMCECGEKLCVNRIKKIQACKKCGKKYKLNKSTLVKCLSRISVK